jgi:hypothetical protein
MLDLSSRLLIDLQRTTEKGDANDIEGTVDLNDWPVHSDAADEELNNMKNNYRATPLAAYDIHDRLIEPGSYRQRLQGAVAEIHFNLSHSAFKGKDTYTADIHSMRVLKPPLPSTLPKKHRLPATFNPPANRRRFV